MVSQILRGLKGFRRRLLRWVGTIYARSIIRDQGDCAEGFVSNGFPIIDFAKTAKVKIGRNFKMNNGTLFNRIGRQQRCYLVVGENAKLKIGENVGISSVAFVCQLSIEIGDNVRIGGNTVIYDTDFHNIDPTRRTQNPEDTSTVSRKPVIIQNNAFIGAHSVILKGVTIGANAVIGAGSVVTRNVPENQIWAGNPARFIRSL